MAGLNFSPNRAGLAAVTSRVDRILTGDHELVAWQQAGLLAPSVVTGIIRTIKQGMIVKKMGAHDFEFTLRRLDL